MISIQLFLGQSLVSININSPIEKLLVLINQSFTLFINLSTAEKANRYYDIKYMELLLLIIEGSILIIAKKITFSLKTLTPQAKL